VADILPANFAINNKIRTLREQWECNITTCKSDFCFVPADGPHFPLGHGHFEKWAAAMVHAPSHPTLLSSNVHLCSGFMAMIWPAWKSCQTSCYSIQFHLTQLYQSRLNAISKEKPPPPMPAAPVINVVLPNNMFNPYQHQPLLSAPQMTGLIPSTHGLGPQMSMEQFCSIFALSEDIFHQLNANKYSGTQAFTHMESNELRELGFKPGEIVDLKEAVLEWASSK